MLPNGVYLSLTSGEIETIIKAMAARLDELEWRLECATGRKSAPANAVKEDEQDG